MSESDLKKKRCFLKYICWGGGERMLVLNLTFCVWCIYSFMWRQVSVLERLQVIYYHDRATIYYLLSDFVWFFFVHYLLSFFISIYIYSHMITIILIYKYVSACVFHLYIILFVIFWEIIDSDKRLWLSYLIFLFGVWMSFKVFFLFWFGYNIILSWWFCRSYSFNIIQESIKFV